MKVAVVYSEEHSRVVNRFGLQNQEWYPPETIAVVVQALKNGGHVAEPVLGDRDLLDRLEKFLPPLSAGEVTGIVFNLAYGIQGQCRYTHVPALLEMMGIPYTGSDPLGHALALDKVVTKRICLAAGIPTPKFAVLSPGEEISAALQYPLVVKPRSEAGSFGLSVADDPGSLRQAVIEVQEGFRQDALVEEFISGREVNVSLCGNDPPDVLPVLELEMTGPGPNVFTHDLKFDRLGRVKKYCPARLSPELYKSVSDLAVRAFDALSLHDYARVDFRIDEHNRPWLLEINSMASINPTSSFVYVAKVAGIGYDDLINNILNVALRRYREAAACFGATQAVGHGAGA